MAPKVSHWCRQPAPAGESPSSRPAAEHPQPRGGRAATSPATEPQPTPTAPRTQERRPSRLPRNPPGQCPAQGPAAATCKGPGEPPTEPKKTKKKLKPTRIALPTKTASRGALSPGAQKLQGKAGAAEGVGVMWKAGAVGAAEPRAAVQPDRPTGPHRDTAGTAGASGAVGGRSPPRPLIRPPRRALTSSAGVSASANVDALGTSPPSPTERAVAAHLHLPSQTQPGPPPTAIGTTKGTPAFPGTTAGCTDTSKSPPHKKIW
ncbi:hypothetical protein NDU88_005930 [Pleurodeles waltl]|uniref:Uncharacterized protein n=1 Tax=Pleurodeles waltl TaxID=8319 RepID=A0AAV7X002_PLEWA|nr:hypothetical protein NDU88_005930 [Pleurodeles waltl]